jgi:hypothetical protein
MAAIPVLFSMAEPDSLDINEAAHQAFHDVWTCGAKSS